MIYAPRRSGVISREILKVGDLGNDKYKRFLLWKTVRTAEPIPLNTFLRFQGKMAALGRSRRNTESGAIRAADRRSHYRQHGRSLTRSAPQNTPDRLFLESSPALSPRGTVSAPLKRARPERTHGAKGSPFPPHTPPSRGPRAWPAGARRDERVRRSFARRLRGAPRRSCRVDRGTDEEDAGSGGRRLVRGGGSSAGNRGRAASACDSRGGASSCGCSARGRSHGRGAGRRAAVPRVHVPRGS